MAKSSVKLLAKRLGFGLLGLVVAAIAVATGTSCRANATTIVEISNGISVVGHTPKLSTIVYNDAASSGAGAQYIARGMCDAGAEVGYAGYAHSPRIISAHEIEYSVTILAYTCDKKAPNYFAVTGYDNGLCPISGWYNAGCDGKPYDIHDCVKYQNADLIPWTKNSECHDVAPQQLGYVDPCGNSGTANRVNNCSAHGNWWATVRGSGDRPPYNIFDDSSRRTYSGFRYTNNNINFLSGSGTVTFIDKQRLGAFCNVNKNDGACSMWNVEITGWLKWENLDNWTTNASSTVGTSSKWDDQSSKYGTGNPWVLRPDQTANFENKLWNSGPSPIRKNQISWDVTLNTTCMSGSTCNNSDQSIDKGSNGDEVANGATVRHQRNSIGGSQDNVGKRFCEHISYTPWQLINNVGQGGSNTSWACAAYPFNYTLSATAYVNGSTSDNAGLVKPGQTVDFTYDVGNYTKDNGHDNTKSLNPVSYTEHIVHKNGNGAESSHDRVYDSLSTVNWWSTSHPKAQNGQGPDRNGNGVDADDKYCSYLELTSNWDVHNWGVSGGWQNTGSKKSNTACMRVPYFYPGCLVGSNCTHNWDSPRPNDCAVNGGCNGTQVAKTDTGVQASVSVVGKDSVQDGDVVRFTYNVHNNGPSKTKPITYTIHTFRIARGHTLAEAIDDKHRVYSSNGSNDVDANTRLSSKLGGASIRQDITNRDSISLVKNGNWSSTLQAPTIGGQVGDLLCTYMTLNNYWAVYDDNPVNSYLTSNLQCVRLGKRPQIEINGADSYAGGGFTSFSQNSPRGSYTQQAQLTNTGSSSFFGAGGHVWRDGSNGMRLIVANAQRQNSGYPTDSTNPFMAGGGLSLNPTTYTKINDIRNTAATVTYGGGSSIDIGSEAQADNAASRVIRVNGDVAVYSSQRLSCNKALTIIATGNAQITTNVVLTNLDNNGACPAAQLPQVRIVANNILIDENVDRVDATLVAAGRLYTIGSDDLSGSALNGLGMRDNTYNGRLTINGAIISAQTPVFRRIFGGGNNTSHNQGDTESRSATSENINYTPDLWLRPYLQRAEGEVTYDYRTVFTTTLPVRY